MKGECFLFQIVAGWWTPNPAVIGERYPHRPLLKQRYDHIEMYPMFSSSCKMQIEEYICITMKKLPLSFYNRKDVLTIAREMLGKVVYTNIDGQITSGRIVETEGYVGTIDKASHAFGGRRTPKNEHMYHGAGTAYIYVCYGMHQMLNIVTNEEDMPDAVLIRAIEPIMGWDIMAQRTGKNESDPTITRGPGNVGKALGVHKRYSGIHLLDEVIYLMDDGFKLPEDAIGVSHRIGVESAGEDALLPYRFYIKGNMYVSGKMRI